MDDSPATMNYYMPREKMWHKQKDESTLKSPY